MTPPEGTRSDNDDDADTKHRRHRYEAASKTKYLKGVMGMVVIVGSDACERVRVRVYVCP